MRSTNFNTDVSELPYYFRIELKHFFENYKTLENKLAIVDEFLPKGKAKLIIDESLQRYRKAFGKT